MDELDSEQRRFPRAPIELKVEYKKLNAFFFDYTRNISKGGTFIKTRQPLVVGTEFIFRLEVPHLQAPLILKGRVKWVVCNEGPAATAKRGEAGMGIEFVYDSDEERATVDRVVEQLMVEQLGSRAYSKLMGKA